MFRKYGFLGIMLIVFVEINFFLKIQPFAILSFPLVWFGYILAIDALVYKIKGNSLISNRLPQFLGMLVISMLLWWVFELVNIILQNWNYIGLESLGVWKDAFGTISFSTVMPAMFETVELFGSVHLFEKLRLNKKYNITRNTLNLIIFLGVLCFIVPLVFPRVAFPLIWVSLFLILDPINYMNKQPSIIGHIRNRKLTIPLCLLLAGIVMGFLWEFWNYWAMPKWIYTVPFVGFFKIFEMPVLGYLGYFPFAFELYAVYWFIRSLFIHKEHLLA